MWSLLPWGVRFCLRFNPSSGRQKLCENCLYKRLTFRDKCEFLWESFTRQGRIFALRGCWNNENQSRHGFSPKSTFSLSSPPAWLAELEALKLFPAVLLLRLSQPPFCSFCFHLEALYIIRVRAREKLFAVIFSSFVCDGEKGKKSFSLACEVGKIRDVKTFFCVGERKAKKSGKNWELWKGSLLARRRPDAKRGDVWGKTRFSHLECWLGG